MKEGKFSCITQGKRQINDLETLAHDFVLKCYCSFCLVNVDYIILNAGILWLCLSGQLVVTVNRSRVQLFFMCLISKNSCFWQILLFYYLKSTIQFLWFVRVHKYIFEVNTKNYFFLLNYTKKGKKIIIAAVIIFNMFVVVFWRLMLMVLLNLSSRKVKWVSARRKCCYMPQISIFRKTAVILKKMLLINYHLI